MGFFSEAARVPPQDALGFQLSEKLVWLMGENLETVGVDLDDFGFGVDCKTDVYGLEQERSGEGLNLAWQAVDIVWGGELFWRCDFWSGAKGVDLFFEQGLSRSLCALFPYGFDFCKKF